MPSLKEEQRRLIEFVKENKTVILGPGMSYFEGLLNASNPLQGCQKGERIRLEKGLCAQVQT